MMRGVGDGSTSVRAVLAALASTALVGCGGADDPQGEALKRTQQGLEESVKMEFEAELGAAGKPAKAQCGPTDIRRNRWSCTVAGSKSYVFRVKVDGQRWTGRGKVLPVAGKRPKRTEPVRLRGTL